jgi:sphingomyelin phosphodiesterase acid-like 3
MRAARGVLLVFLLLVTVQSIYASAPTIPVAMLSDLHFDPFHDPAKLPQLIKAPVDDWPAILSSPDSATQAADFAAVQKACKAKELQDAPYALLNSALTAAQAQHPLFVTVTGDLLVHNLDCRYRASLKLPASTTDDESLSADFAAKTTVFVMKQVASTFKGTPVYLALGNNDSRCNHNRLDLHDAYLKATGQAVIDALVGVSKAERKRALETYQSAGYYAVTMSKPMVKTRLLVLDDIYLMTKYANCEADEKDQQGANEQIAWLNNQLDDARKHREQVWVMGHLPPLINAFSTLIKGAAICSGANVTTYLFTGQLSTALTTHADIVRLALFGHTHMDELALLGTAASGVPVKVIASVTAVSGNTPSFTVSQVQPSTATLMDYSTYIASNQTGNGTKWDLEYRFGETYHEPSFTPSSLDELITRFSADASGTTAESQAYATHFFKGAPISELAPFWSGYVCSMNHATASDFKSCTCKTK